MKTLFFDMDGTLAGLFFVKGFKDALAKEDSTPYEIANPLFKVDEMKEVITALKADGWKIGIISYTGADCSVEFIRKTVEVKKAWLTKYFPYADEIHIVKPEISKTEFAKSADDILVDDSTKNRTEWEQTGRTAINAYFRAKIPMIEALKALL